MFFFIAFCWTFYIPKDMDDYFVFSGISGSDPVKLDSHLVELTIELRPIPTVDNQNSLIFQYKPSDVLN